jgi:hypothetical protein
VSILIHYTRIDHRPADVWVLVSKDQGTAYGLGTVMMSGTRDFVVGTAFGFSSRKEVDDPNAHFTRDWVSLDEAPDHVAATYMKLVHKGEISP